MSSGEGGTQLFFTSVLLYLLAVITGCQATDYSMNGDNIIYFISIKT